MPLPGTIPQVIRAATDIFGKIPGKFGWCLLVTMLCNSPSVACRLGYHEVWIINSLFLETIQKLLLPNIFTLDTISLSSYLPLFLCGSVFLVAPREEPVVSLHSLRFCTQLVYFPTCSVIRIFFLTPPHILPHRKNTCHFWCYIYQVPLPFTEVSPPRCHPWNMSCNTVTEIFQYCHHWISNLTYFIHIKKH